MSVNIKALHAREYEIGLDEGGTKNIKLFLWNKLSETMHAAIGSCILGIQTHTDTCKALLFFWYIYLKALSPYFCVSLAYSLWLANN